MSAIVKQRSKTPRHVNDREPNFYAADRFYLVRCFCKVHGHYGRENYALNVSSGICTWCGWSEEEGGDIE